MKSMAKLLVIMTTLAMASGCVYRLAVQQGNIAKPDDVDQVTVGMTPSQVRFLLGTPLVDDPFNDDRWDYVFYSRIGRNEPIRQRLITVYFEDGKVSRIEKPDRSEIEGVPDDDTGTGR